MKRYTNKSDLRFFEVDKLSDIMKDPRIIMDHLPITGSYYDEYRTNFKIATHSHGPVSYIARRVMHEGFRETFIDETLDFELQKYFGDELQLILEGHGWQIPQVLANVFQLLHDTYRDKYFGLTQKVMADPRKLENQVEVLEKQVKRHLALRVEHFLRKQTTRQPLSSAENVFLLEIAITIVQQIIIPYVQSIHAEEAMLRDKHRPKTIRDIFKV